MHIVTKRRLKELWDKYPDAERPLTTWFKTTKKADWRNLVDARTDFPHADLVGVCTIFDIGGGKYRLITKIFYPNRKVLVRFVLTHREYDKGQYKNDCKC